MTHNGISLHFWPNRKQVGERGKTSEQSPTEMDKMEEHCQTFVSSLSLSPCSDKCSFHSHLCYLSQAL